MTTEFDLHVLGKNAEPWRGLIVSIADADQVPMRERLAAADALFVTEIGMPAMVVLPMARWTVLVRAVGGAVGGTP